MNHATYTDTDGTTYYVEYGAPYKRTGSTMTARDLLRFALTASGITRADVSAAILSLTWDPADPFSYANAVTDAVCRLFGISEEGQS